MLMDAKYKNNDINNEKEGSKILEVLCMIENIRLK